MLIFSRRAPSTRQAGSTCLDYMVLTIAISFASLYSMHTLGSNLADRISVLSAASAWDGGTEGTEPEDLTPTGVGPKGTGTGSKGP